MFNRLKCARPAFTVLAVRIADSELIVADKNQYGVDLRHERPSLAPARAGISERAA
jgi:hypothetical protein